MDPLGFDPMPSMLSALEKQIESTTVPGPPSMDPMSQMLGQLEASIEGTTTAPTRPEAPDLFAPTAPEPPSLAWGGPRSPDPPFSSESTSHIRTAIEPSPAARPFFAHDGLSREPYRPHPGSNPGSLGRTSVPTRWCPDRGEAVELTACEECDKWDDHDGQGQMEECLYDWEAKQQAKEGQEDESEE